MAVWSEEQRWQYVREHGYEVVDEMPDGFRFYDSQEPKPWDTRYIARGSHFGYLWGGEPLQKKLMVIGS